MVYSVLWVMQDLHHQPHDGGIHGVPGSLGGFNFGAWVAGCPRAPFKGFL